jgi:hypothetical protein
LIESAAGPWKLWDLHCVCFFVVRELSTPFIPISVDIHLNVKHIHSPHNGPIAVSSLPIAIAEPSWALCLVQVFLFEE